MHGLVRMLRQSMINAKPWQRYAASAAFLALGVTVILLGQFKGVVLVLFGGLMLFESLHYGSISRRRGQQKSQINGDE